MFKQRIINKEENCYCLLTSHSNPNFILPVKAIVKDYKWDNLNPQYKIKIINFYDNITILKKYFFDMNFVYAFDTRAAKFKLNASDFKNTDSILKRLNEEDHERFFVIVDSLMVTRKRYEMERIFSMMQLYLISKNFTEIKDMTTRGFYQGTLRINSKAEFDARFKLAYSDLFENKMEDINEYISSLT